MKKILAPIDFSVHADNAVKFAIEIAKKTNACIHLLHVLETPELIAMPELVVWPIEDFAKLEQAAKNDMEKYIAKLKADATLAYSYLPDINFTIEFGLPKQMIEKQIKELKPDLVVMGTEGKGKLDRFFLGSTTLAMIEKTTTPMLLIPKDANYATFKKIAFATNFSENDIYSIHEIARLFCFYDTEILVIHIGDMASDFEDPNSPANKFLKKVTDNINYGKIYYRHLREADIDKGLKWLTEHGQVDMLSMIHRHSGMLSRLLGTSHTQKLAKSIHLPLLVMPEKNSHELIKTTQI